MSCNPEDDTIAAIDALIDEQLEAGWHDDYDVNQYPDCNLCPHDWHGIPCLFCACPTSTGEVSKAPYVDMIESARHSCDDMAFDIDPEAPLWRPDEDQGGSALVFDHEPRRDINFDIVPSRGYTERDIEAMRRAWHRTNPYRSQVRPDRCIIAGDQPQLTLRFWARNPDDGTLHMVQGTAEGWQVNWTRDGVTMVVQLDDVLARATDADDEEHQPAGVLVNGMISVERAIAEGFETVGCMAPEDLEVETVRDDDRIWGIQEYCEVTMRAEGSLLGQLTGWEVPDART